MHLPQIVADLKYRRKIAEKVFSPELLGVRSIGEFCGKKIYNFFSRPNLNYFVLFQPFYAWRGLKADDARKFLPYVHLVEG
jgi:hypothetical protein